MAPETTSILIAFALLFATTAHCFEFAQFGYSGATGPDKWGSLSPSFSECSNGKSQSPININKNETVQNSKLSPLTRDYKAANATLINNGFNIAVHFESECGNLNMDGKNYALKQLHWHTPSEHQIDGEQFDAELHLVHRAEDGTFAVVAILFKIGDSDSFVSKLEDKLGELAQDVCGGDEEAHVPMGKMDNKLLRKNTRKYYKYIGSLTTPPCTENVSWHILGKVREISKEQLEALKKPLSDEYKNNCRPLQPLNGRTVELYNELDQ